MSTCSARPVKYGINVNLVLIVARGLYLCVKDQRNRFDEKSSHMLYEACSNFSTPGGGRCAGFMVVVQMHDNEMGE